MRQKLRQRRLIDRAGGRQGAARVVIRAVVGAHPVVEQGAARAGVEGADLAVVAEPGQVGDAADVEDGERPLEAAGQGGVVERRQGRALAAGGEVAAAEIRDHVDGA